MDFFANELRAGELAPILLGNSSYSKSIARKIFGRYGMISHIFCGRVPFLRRFSLTAKYHSMVGFEKDELLLIALKDFAKGVQNRDVVLYLIPGTEKAKQFVRRNRERLENDFVIANTQSLAKLIGIDSLI